MDKVRDALSLRRERQFGELLYLESPLIHDRRVFFCARLALTLVMDVAALCSVAMEFQRGHWLIYLTHWTLTVQLGYLNLATFATYVNAKRYYETIGAAALDDDDTRNNRIFFSSSLHVEIGADKRPTLSPRLLFLVGALHVSSLPPD